MGFNIGYIPGEKLFKIDTENTTYAFAVVDDRYLCHVYYGARIEDTDIRYLLREDEPPFVPSVNKREANSFLDCAHFEYPQQGMGDYRDCCISIEDPEGYTASEFFYDSYVITHGKPSIPGLPAVFGTNDDCETLTVTLKDAKTGLKLNLFYSIFDGIDAVMRSVSVENCGQAPVKIHRILSACIDMNNSGFEVMGLFGSWARERHIQRMPLGYGRQNISSVRGESSHQEHPFIALVTPDTTQDHGEVYAMNFVYSSSFFAQAERDQFDSVRLTMGISPEYFTWKLQPGEVFHAPEVVMVYSAEGIGHMTHTFHDLYRNHLIRSRYKDMPRPVLINSWEACYFDFDSDKLIKIAEEAHRLGIEMFVMDDGWFGHRNSDEGSLGDWYVNEEKIKGGLKSLSDRLHAIGMKFGIWMEPEMISPDSDLYREHPDWAIQLPGRDITLSRAQYVLDLSRQEVVDEIYSRISAVLRSADIDYVKWDMNRQLTTLGSAALPADRQGELSHRYMLGVYQMQERLIRDFPDILLENCSGGGARFDPGMLYYSPQIWCSDDTDAVERLGIQEGTEMIYPVSAIGSHVSVCPNHIAGRVTPMETRGNVALSGTFGYELDVTKLSEEDKEAVKEQIQLYKKYNELIRNGDYYRLLSLRETHLNDAWMIAGKNRSEALVTYVQVIGQPNVKSSFLRLKGLDPDRYYETDGRKYSGRLLMNAGIRIEMQPGDFRSRLIYLHAVE